jgi:serine/threonine protein phosphatase PrpC
VDVSHVNEGSCPSCGAPLQPDDRFCEQCGARLLDAEQAETGCQVCGAPGSEIDADGYCLVCGSRTRDPGDRVELDLGHAAAVSDRGRVHRRNEDAFRLEAITEECVAAVVCDGISSASAGDTAARDGAEAAASVLARGLTERAGDTSAITGDAIGAANAAVAQVPWTTRTNRDMPSCTLVCALWRAGEIVIGSVGDSRAYWIDADGGRQLTVDDSWAEAQVSEGRLTPEQALRDSRSHSITNWIGADAPSRPPRLVKLQPDTSGRLLLCTDGLWNYVSSETELADLITTLPAESSAAAVASALTDVALKRGGRDNITVAVIDIRPSQGEADGHVHS